ncbi:MAG: alpha/beta hydrolase, partial [Bdellovibrionales bacterium]|nr:alpha/beta hydrolase [Bdellovibrionales bacterium]
MWLLLRGLARESGHWGNFPQLLASRVGESPVSLNLPGCGERNQERASGNLSRLLSQVHEKTDPKQKKILVGVSLGGMLALQWAYEHPEEVRGVVVINSSASNLSWPWQRFSPKAIRTLFHALTSRGEEREKTILELVCNAENVRRRYLPTFKVLAEHRPVHFSNARRQLRAARHFRVKKLSQPGLIVVSEKDKLASPVCSQALASFLNWPIVSHPSAGHDLALEDPAWLADQIARWSQSLPKN